MARKYVDPHPVKTISSYASGDGRPISAPWRKTRRTSSQIMGCEWISASVALPRFVIDLEFARRPPVGPSLLASGRRRARWNSIELLFILGSYLT